VETVSGSVDSFTLEVQEFHGNSIVTTNTFMGIPTTTSTGTTYEDFVIDARH